MVGRLESTSEREVVRVGSCPFGSKTQEEKVSQPGVSGWDGWSMDQWWMVDQERELS